MADPNVATSLVRKRKGPKIGGVSTGPVAGTGSDGAPTSARVKPVKASPPTAGRVYTGGSPTFNERTGRRVLPAPPNRPGTKPGVGPTGMPPGRALGRYKQYRAEQAAKVDGTGEQRARYQGIAKEARKVASGLALGRAKAARRKPGVALGKMRKFAQARNGVRAGQGKRRTPGPVKATK